MSNTQERKKQRRRYLMSKGAAYFSLSIDAFAAVTCALAALLLLILSLCFHYKHPGQIILSCVTLSLALFFLSWFSARSARQAHRTAKRILYIPPVTTDTLPAEEVLVRGSEEPAQEQSQVLLRGTDRSQDNAQQELLRGSQQQ